MIDPVRWMISLGLGGVAALIILGNWLCLIGAFRSKGSTSLVLPFFCGPACAVACLVCPNDRVRSLAWLPMLLDPSICLVLPAIFFQGVARWVGGRALATPNRSRMMRISVST